MGEKTLIEGHRKYWQNLWMNDIIIEGHAEDQKNVRMMLYHCYAFNDWKSYGISPMGLSGLGYNGHVFWDMDLWIYPGILGLNPNLAKTLIEYRFERAPRKERKKPPFGRCLVLSSITSAAASLYLLGTTSQLPKMLNGCERNVVAADEWAENVDDNAFTNAVASESLRLFNLASKKLGYLENKKCK
jgi:trehalose/maltose hydrolase-like predicted phosphorylase